ncbi:MAG: RluA family pseudouridine synthase [Muribaculaceae bacterium]|nr:RluA family pseudouridine synthase [Bacteroidales bacterium]MBD5325548.1 RluA family pseudouridine synthase [Bacteroides sp.]MDE6223183.1 RluA family pseudouridine synthase [Muribaculaceae bacterium]MBD5327076.1 RluA family pseudouridine synthase [Bacteroides sp.]MBD5425027.1 RluA family pseudouridine synthase [Bacteroides sp.]
MKFPAPVRPDKIMSFTVDENAGELRLIDFLAEKLPQCKRTGLKQMLAHRQVKVAGNIVSQATRPLAGGEEVMVNLTREFREFYHRRLRIVHEDDHIIVIHKGYGLLSMADDSARNVETAYSILRDYLKKEHPSNKLFIVHRLDRDTSGLMLFAKTIEAKETLQHNWNNMVLERKYLCVVEGTPDPAEGTVRSYLCENSRHEVYSTPDESKGGKLAVTRYRTLSTRGNYSLVECELDTGRKNQIRVHMKQLGTPISGDRRYGGSPSQIHRMALHAQTLKFIHPETRRPLAFTTPVPDSFRRLI